MSHDNGAAAAGGETDEPASDKRHRTTAVALRISPPAMRFVSLNLKAIGRDIFMIERGRQHGKLWHSRPICRCEGRLCTTNRVARVEHFDSAFAAYGKSPRRN